MQSLELYINTHLAMWGLGYGVDWIWENIKSKSDGLETGKMGLLTLVFGLLSEEIPKNWEVRVVHEKNKSSVRK